MCDKLLHHVFTLARSEERRRAASGVVWWAQHNLLTLYHRIVVPTLNLAQSALRYVPRFPLTSC